MPTYKGGKQKRRGVATLLNLRGRAAKAPALVASSSVRWMMTKSAFWKVALLSVLLLLGGCVAYMSSMQSSFFSKFSLKQLVETTKSRSGLTCSSSGGGGGMGAGTGGIGRSGSHFSKTESFSCQITNTDQFDQKKFISALKEEVESELKDAKLKITSSQDRDAGFHVEYEFGDVKGNVAIESRLDPGNYFTVKADLTENRAEAK